MTPFRRPFVRGTQVDANILAGRVPIGPIIRFLPSSMVNDKELARRPVSLSDKTAFTRC